MPEANEIIEVTEEQNGGAVATMPEGTVLPGGGTLPENGAPTEDERLVSATPEQSDEILEQNDGLANDPDREAIRAARRDERRLKKQIHREKTKESNHLIVALRKQNQQMAERLAQLEKRTSGAELARVDNAIKEVSTQVDYAKMKMQEAVSLADGVALTTAQESWYEAQRRLESLVSIKDQATKQMSQPTQTLNVPDPLVQEQAAAWMQRNPWYNPNGADMESEITARIDKRLTDEGFDPSSQEYWDELDNRIQKFVPKTPGAVYNQLNTRNERPRPVVTSSGRESMANARPNEFRISPERVNAMREAGVWDDPAQRKKAIANYIAWDRKNNTSRSN